MRRVLVFVCRFVPSIGRSAGIEPDPAATLTNPTTCWSYDAPQRTQVADWQGCNPAGDNVDIRKIDNQAFRLSTPGGSRGQAQRPYATDERCKIGAVLNLPYLGIAITYGERAVPSIYECDQSLIFRLRNLTHGRERSDH